MHKIDLYLSRVSQIVQVGLFVTTLFTLYYTVIPLYKNAQLEESLARKELEYESLKLRSNKTLSKINSWEYGQFAISAAECSGLPKILLVDKPRSELQSYSPSKVISCVRKKFSEYEFTEMNATQRAVVERRISALASGLINIYQDALNAYNEYPAVLDRMLSEGKAPESHVDMMDKIFNELGYQLSDDQKRESYISSERYSIQLERFSKVREYIIKTLGDRRSLDNEAL
ncbi:hypothetical protein [Pseudomonas sp. Marseille-QA0332]